MNVIFWLAVFFCIIGYLIFFGQLVFLWLYKRENEYQSFVFRMAGGYGALLNFKWFLLGSACFIIVLTIGGSK